MASKRKTKHSEQTTVVTIEKDKDIPEITSGVIEAQPVLEQNNKILLHSPTPYVEDVKKDTVDSEFKEVKLLTNKKLPFSRSDSPLDASDKIEVKTYTTSSGTLLKDGVITTQSSVPKTTQVVRLNTTLKAVYDPETGTITMREVEEEEETDAK